MPFIALLIPFEECFVRQFSKYYFERIQSKLMKQYVLKTFVFLLALTMMLSAFVACGKEDDNQTITDADTDAETEAPDEEGTTEETEPEYPLGVQQENNNNKEIVILMSSSNTIEIAKEASSERVAQAMYERNCDAEEYLGVLITINNEHNGSWNVRAAYNDVIRNDVKDLHTLDIITMMTSCSFVTLAQEGLLKNLTDVTSFDFDAPWWVPDMVGQYGMNGNLYGVYGDMTLSLYASMSTIYFNAKLIDDYSIESPYDMVRNNTWTLENMIKNAKLVEESVDGEYDPMTNKMGFMGLHTAQRTWIAALDLDLVDRNADTGELTVPKGPSDKLITLFDSFYDLFEDENEFYVHSNSSELHQTFMNGTVLYMLTYLNAVRDFRGMEDDYGLVPMPKYNDQQDTIRKAFKEDRVLAAIHVLESPKYNLRDMESDYIILPMPKYDEAQAEYYSPVSMWCTSLLSVPITASNPERTGIIIEALSAESLYTLTPAYYEISLQGKAVRDEESAAMLDIIFETRVYDLGLIWDFGGFRTAIVTPKHIEVASTVASVKSAAETQIAELYQTISEIEG